MTKRPRPRVGLPARPPVRPSDPPPLSARADRRRKPADERPPRPEVRKTASPEELTPQALLGTYRPDLLQVLASHDVLPYRYAQVVEHLFSRPLVPFEEATALPLDLRRELDTVGASTLAIAGERTSPDGTTKFVLQAGDNTAIETVLMQYAQRVTACLSSQAGCPVGCAFCATGAMGLQRNLTAAEIVDQARTIRAHADGRGLRLSNVVYMGMGEPLLNLRSVLDSIRIIADPHGFALSRRSISVSTVGIPAGIRALARTEPQVNLALSLHASDDSIRDILVPARFRHPIAEILKAAWDHFEITGRKLLIEYVLLRDVNDSPDDARRLAALLRGHVVAVNLLPWNPVRPQAAVGRADARPPRMPVFRPPSPAAVAAFRQTLLAARVEAVVRRSKGVGIDAACGQLAGRRVV